MSLLSKDAILGAADLPFVEVDVPEWGGTVRMKTLTGAERDAWEAASIRGNGKNRQVNMVNIRARLVGQVLVDADGNRLFGDEEIKLLGRKSAKALDRLFDKARDLNGIGEDDVDELAEGFEHAQSDASSFD